MTDYSVQAPLVFTSIAAFSFPVGVRCVDISGIPENGVMTPGVLYPNPEIGLFQTTSAKITTLGVAGAEKIDFEYDISYRYIHCQIGGGAVLIGSALSSAISKIVGIINVFLTQDTPVGSVDMRLKSMSKWPVIVQDPSGNSFWGCDFTLHIIEYLQ